VGNGPTFLVTAIGILALGICKDLLQRSPQVLAGQVLYTQVAPLLALSPAFADSVHDIEDLRCTLLKDLACAVLFANACGNVRKHLTKGQRCHAPGEPDLRSFNAAPRRFFEVEPLGGEIVEDAFGVRTLKAACDGSCGRLVTGRLRTR